MRSKQEISDRQAELEQILVLLQKEHAEELTKPINTRSQPRLLFLYKETSVYEAALSELEWVLDEQ
jgi:hypothetical protein